MVSILLPDLCSLNGQLILRDLRTALSLRSRQGSAPIHENLSHATLHIFILVFDLTFILITGHYGATTGLGTSTCSGKCAAGYYCSGMNTSPTPSGKTCAPGRYGVSGATTAQCTGPCAAGYYCPGGSSTATDKPCGGVARYCPAGSSTYQTVPAAHYSTPLTVNVNVRTGYAKCEPGYYCTGGQRFPCPAGRYGSAEGETKYVSSQCVHKRLSRNTLPLFCRDFELLTAPAPRCGCHHFRWLLTNIVCGV